ncbi:hypothetical protein C2E23DRAFT_937200 [Lenzites betulinus]|nr:hypothetical protein C2E23DRAFT_937200 [Lenzites betulinus]
MVSSQDSRTCALAGGLLESLKIGADSFRFIIQQLQDLDRIVAHSLSLVRSAINDHRPVHQLPAEILALIFRYALPSNDAEFHHSGEEEVDLHAEHFARVIISHVCKRWRAVSLEMATFWTVIDTHHAPWATTYFERSGTMPLHLYLRYPPENTMETPLISQGPRIRDMSIELQKKHDSIIPLQLPMYLPAVPNLECLTIVTRSRPFEEGRPMIDLDHCPPLFPAEPPRLRTLILKGQCWFPAIPYEQITHLHINKSTPVDLTVIIGLLRRCVSLEALVLADVYLAHARTVPDNCSASLPRLRLLTLSITQSRLSMRRFLPCLRLPTTDITVRILGREAGRALADLHPFPTLPFAAHLDTLTLDAPGPDLRGLVLQAHGAAANVGLLLDLGDSYTSAAHALGKTVLPVLLPYGSITRLAMRAPRCDVVAQLLPAHLPALTSVRVVDAAGPSVTDALAGKAVGVALRDVADIAPQTAEAELWSPRAELGVSHPAPAGARPSALFNLRRFTLCHVRGAGDRDGVLPAGMGERAEELARSVAASVEEVECRMVDAADAGKFINLPGVRPSGHAYSWD